jgi:hypothetical protein
MSILSLDDDLRAFLLRVTASLEQVDNTVREAQRFLMESQKLVDEVRVELAAMKAGRKAIAEA